MEDLSGDLDYLSDDVTQTEFDEWLQTTDVFEQDVERPAQEVIAPPPVQRPKRSDFKHKSSLEHIRCEKDVFGIDFSTALRAADRKVGAGTQNSWMSSASSLRSKSESQSSTSPRPVIDLTATEPTIIDLTTTDTLPQPPILCKRARRTFDSNINIEQMLTLMGKPSSSSVAATVARVRHNFPQRTKSCPPTRRSSVNSIESINGWQKLSHLDSRKRSFPESMSINNWQKKSHQVSRRISLPEPMPPTSTPTPTSSEDSTPPTSFFHKMDEYSTQFHRMMSNSSAASHVRDCTNSTSVSMLSTKKHFNEFQGAMEQTQQSRRMIMGALSPGGTRSDGINDVASSARVDALAVKKMPEFGIQCGLGVVASLPNPIRNSSDATRTKNVVTKAETEAKRHLESIAREQMILEKRLAEMYRRFER